MREISGVAQAAVLSISAQVIDLHLRLLVPKQSQGWVRPNTISIVSYSCQNNGTKNNRTATPR